MKAEEKFGHFKSARRGWADNHSPDDEQKKRF